MLQHIGPSAELLFIMQELGVFNTVHTECPNHPLFFSPSPHSLCREIKQVLPGIFGLAFLSFHELSGAANQLCRYENIWADVTKKNADSVDRLRLIRTWYVIMQHS